MRFKQKFNEPIHDNKSERSQQKIDRFLDDSELIIDDVANLVIVDSGTPFHMKFAGLITLN